MKYIYIKNKVIATVIYILCICLKFYPLYVNLICLFFFFPSYLYYES